MKLMKNKKYLQQKFSRKVLVPQTTANFTSRVNKNYVPFTCKFPMVMHFVQSCFTSDAGLKPICYVFSYDKTSLKFCASFRFFLVVFMEKFQKNLLSELCEKRNSTVSLASVDIRSSIHILYERCHQTLPRLWKGNSFTSQNGCGTPKT